MSFVAHRLDRCKIMTAQAPANGEPVGTFQEGSEIRCRFYRMDYGNEPVQGGAAPLFDATIVLARGTSLTSKDRVRLTRNGRGVVDEIYAVVGAPWRPTDGRGTLNAKLKRIHGGSLL
jgi:hypothetical protein